jgi:hypothetical protein
VAQHLRIRRRDFLFALLRSVRSGYRTNRLDNVCRDLDAFQRELHRFGSFKPEDPLARVQGLKHRMRIRISRQRLGYCNLTTNQ